MLAASLTTPQAHTVLRGRAKTKENVVGKHTFLTEMEVTENLNSRKLQINDIYNLKSRVRRVIQFWIFCRNGGRLKK